MTVETQDNTFEPLTSSLRVKPYIPKKMHLFLLGLNQFSFGYILTCVLVVAVRVEAPLLVTLFVPELSMTANPG